MPEESVLVRRRVGDPVAGVVTVEQLPTGGSPGVAVDTQAVFARDVTPAGSGFAIVTAKAGEREAPPAGSEEMVRVQVAPASLLGEQVQPGWLTEGRKVVLAGTVSVRVTGEASRLPELVTVRV